MDEDLLRFNKKQKYVCFDFETESLNLGFSRPWQLFFLTGEGDYINVRANRLIKWDDLDVSPDAARVTGFRYDTYLPKARDAKTVLDEFDKYLLNPEYRVIGHNILGFDVYQYGVWRRALGLKPDYSWIPRVIDTACLAKAKKLGLKPDRKNLTAWMYRMYHTRAKGLKFSLQLTAREYGIVFEEEERWHDAAFDVPANFFVWNKQKHEMDV